MTSELDKEMVCEVTKGSILSKQLDAAKDLSARKSGGNRFHVTVIALLTLLALRLMKY